MTFILLTNVIKMQVHMQMWEKHSNLESPSKYIWNTQENWVLISGASYQQYFRVIESEVFKVEWDRRVHPW